MIVVAAIAQSVLEIKQEKKTKENWLKTWLQRRSQLVVFNTLLQEMLKLFTIVKGDIKKQNMWSQQQYISYPLGHPIQMYN